MEGDLRVPGFLGRVLDGSAQPVGTCFQVTPGVLVTAWHVLDELGAGDVDAVVDLDPLQGGSPRQARVRRVDPVHDLAVVSTTRPLAACVSGLATTDEVELDTKASITGVSHVEDPGHSHRYLDASGEWRGGTTRDDQIPLGRLWSADVVLGMSGAPVRCRDGAVSGWSRPGTTVPMTGCGARCGWRGWRTWRRCSTGWPRWTSLSGDRVPRRT